MRLVDRGRAWSGGSSSSQAREFIEPTGLSVPVSQAQVDRPTEWLAASGSGSSGRRGRPAYVHRAVTLRLRRTVKSRIVYLADPDLALKHLGPQQRRAWDARPAAALVRHERGASSSRTWRRTRGSWCMGTSCGSSFLNWLLPELHARGWRTELLKRAGDNMLLLAYRDGGDTRRRDPGRRALACAGAGAVGGSAGRCAAAHALTRHVRRRRSRRRHAMAAQRPVTRPAGCRCERLAPLLVVARGGRDVAAAVGGPDRSAMGRRGVLHSRNVAGRGRGYRLLNEPGEIEAVQYPPLLPAIVAVHQLVLGTSDPTTVGRWLRLSSFLVFVSYGAGRAAVPAILPAARTRAARDAAVGVLPARLVPVGRVVPGGLRSASRRCCS